MTPRYAHVKPSPDPLSIREKCGEASICVRRKLRVRVQEKQQGASRDLCAGVHLRTSPTRRGKNAVYEKTGLLDCRIKTSAIDDDHLGSPFAEWAETPESVCNDRFFVQSRNDDRQMLQARLVAHACFLSMSRRTGLKWGKNGDACRGSTLLQ